MNNLLTKIHDVSGLLIRRGTTKLEVTAFIVGAAILMFELTAARIMSPYLGDTIYTWTSIIGVILAALATGYYIGGRLADKRTKASDIAILLSVAGLLIVFLNFVKDPIIAFFAGLDTTLQLQAFLASLMLFAPATVVMGITAPYLARLSISSVISSGRHLSRIDAASTVGSLVGTFLTGYVLFNLVGSRFLLAGIALLLVVTGLLFATKRTIVLQISILVVVVIGCLIAPRALIVGLVQEIDTAYSKIIIIEGDYNGRPFRGLQTGNEGLQSGIYMDGKTDQPFAYIRQFSNIARSIPMADRFLIIGGGAFTFPQSLANEKLSSIVDTVEIDDTLPRIGADYFQFTRPPNLQIITQDGRLFLNRTDKRYDMIFVDAFNGTIPPFQLFTVEAAERMKASLMEDGLVVINLISAVDGPDAAMIQTIYRTMNTTFEQIAVYQVNETDKRLRQNLILVGAKRTIPFAQLTGAANGNPEFADMLNRPVAVDDTMASVLTDDFAPIDQLAR